MKSLYTLPSLRAGYWMRGALLIAAIIVWGCEAPASETEEGEDQGEEEVVQLSAAELEEFDIELDTAQAGTLSVRLTLPGEVKVNEERYAHVMTRVGGVVRSVRKSVGDPVRSGEVMAVLESRELADLKSSYLAAREREDLARSNFEREDRLYEKKISSEQEYLEAKQAHAEARIELRSAGQKLLVLGFAASDIEKMSGEIEESLILYPLRAPFSGSVIERNIAQGEALEADAEAFEVADLSTVWVDLDIYQKDIPRIYKGQEVTLSAGFELPEAYGRISYVRPIVGEESRTSYARIILPNTEGIWRPGSFVRGTISMSSIEVPVLVPRSALQMMDESAVIFVKTDEGFEPRAVTIGEESELEVSILSGLLPGEEYVARGAFFLKSQLAKSEFGEEEDE